MTDFHYHHGLLRGPCDQCSRTVWKYLPKHESHDLCLSCLDAVEPFWREKQLGIRVLHGGNHE